MKHALLLALIFVAACVPGFAQTYRAFWADGFHDGYKTPAQVDQLIADTKLAGANALVIQIRRRGNSFYIKSLEPPVMESGYSPDFDALADVITKAHAAGIEVHAWFAVCPLGGDAEMKSDPRHILNVHGPSATGRDNWIALGDKGQIMGASSNYWLDPGHPDAAAYTSDVIQNVAENYDVDGIHLDTVRYSDSVTGVSAWGYNPVSVDRFNRLWQSTGVPAPSSAAWADFRRQQLSAMVRRIYLRAIAFRPQIKVTASLIAWGDGPASPSAWLASSAYSAVMQDWVGWLREGILDVGMPMNYDRESNSSQKRYFDNWLTFERANQGTRMIVPGPAAYLNTIDETMAQARRVLNTPAGANSFGGVIFYSYACTNAFLCGTGGTVPATNAQFYAAAADLFASFGPARPPDLPWKMGSPAPGHIIGQILVDGKPGAPLADGMRVQLKSPDTRTLVASTAADGNGYFGFVNVSPAPGTFSLSAYYGNGQVVPETNLLEIRNGLVTRVVLDIPGNTIAAVRPGIGNGGMASAANYDNSAVAPGQLLALFGANLSASTLAAVTLPLPTVLGGSQMLVIDGSAPDSSAVAAPLLFVSPTQVNIQLPFGLKGPNVKIVVRSAGAESLSSSVPLATAVPGLFGDALGVYVFSSTDWSRNSAARPARPGDVLILYATGLGELRETVAAGQAAPGRAIASTAAVSCTLGGRSAEVLYAGVAPGFVSGVYQLNVKIPLDAAAGNAVPLQLSVAGRTSNTGAVAIR